MDKKTFILAILIITISVPTALAAYNAYRHTSFTIGDGKDIDLFGNFIGHGNIKDVVCTTNCTGFTAVSVSTETNASNLTIGTIANARLTADVYLRDANRSYSAIISTDGTNYFYTNLTGYTTSNTNASLQFNAAKNDIYAQTYYGSIYVKSGLYNLSYPIQTLYGMKLIGENWQNTILSAGKSMDAVIIVNKTTDARMELESLRIDANNNATYGINYSVPETSTQVRMRNIQILGSKSWALFLDGNEDTQLTGMLLHDKGIHWYSPSGATWIDHSYINGQNNFSGQICEFSNVVFYNNTNITCNAAHFQGSYFGSQTTDHVTVSGSSGGNVLSIKDSFWDAGASKALVNINGSGNPAMGRVELDNLANMASSGNMAWLRMNGNTLGALIARQVVNLNQQSPVKVDGTGTITSFYISYSNPSNVSSGTAIYSNTNQTYQASI